MARITTRALLAIGVGAVVSSNASAQIGIGLGPPRQWTAESQRPVRGYSGFVRQGARSYYCDYVRYPSRNCFVDRTGRERCRITSWRMEQRCY